MNANVREQLIQRMNERSIPLEEQERILSNLAAKTQQAEPQAPQPAEDTGGIANQALAGVGEGGYNTLGMPVDMAASGMRAIGLPIPQNPVFGSRWWGELGGLLGNNPYEVPRGTGVENIVREGARGATESVMGAVGLGKLPGLPTPTAGVLATEAATGFSGGMTAGAIQNQGGGPVAQMAGEIAGSVGPLLPAKTAGWVWNKLQRGGMAPITTKKGFRQAVGGLTQDVAGPDAAQRGSTALGAPSRFQQMQATLGVDNIPTFIVYPELKKYAAAMSQNPDIWEALLKDQTGLSETVLRKLEKIAPEVGIDFRDVRRIVQSNVGTTQRRLASSLDEKVTKLDDLRSGLTQETASDASSRVSNLFLDAYEEAQDLASEPYRALPQDVRQLNGTMPVNRLETLRDTWMGKAEMEGIEPLASTEIDTLPTTMKKKLDKMLSTAEGEAVSIKELGAFRSSLLEEMRRLRSAAPSQGRKRRNVAIALDAVEDIFDEVAAQEADNPIAARFVQELRQANKGYKDHMKLFHSGLVGKTLKKDLQGGLRVPETAFLGKFLRDPDSAAQLKHIVGDTPELSSAVSAHFASDLFRTTDRSAKSMRNVLQRHDAVLREFPEVRKQLQDVVYTKQAVEDLGGQVTAWNKAYESSSAKMFYGEDADTAVRSLLSTNDTAKRRGMLKDVLAHAGESEAVKTFFARKYYDDLFTGIDPKRNPMERLLSLDTNAIRAKLEDRGTELARLFGERWPGVRGGVNALLDTADELKEGMIAERGTLKGLEEGFTSIHRALTSTLSRVWGVQRQVVSPLWAATDRSVALMSKIWTNYGPEQANQILSKALVDFEYAEALSWKATEANIEKLRRLYFVNIQSQATQLAAREDPKDWSWLQRPGVPQQELQRLYNLQEGIAP